MDKAIVEQSLGEVEENLSDFKEYDYCKLSYLQTLENYSANQKILKWQH